MRGIYRSASMSEGSAGNPPAYRWTLERSWRTAGDEARGQGRGRFVCWIMLNPSTADARVDDPTVKRCIEFTDAWGYGRLIIVNLYPLRTSRPEECQRWAGVNGAHCGGCAADRDALEHNAAIVVSTAKRADLVVAAWGAAPWAIDWAETIVERIGGGDGTPPPFPPLYCLGETQGGEPKHPLARGAHRVPADARPVIWREGAAA